MPGRVLLSPPSRSEPPPTPKNRAVLIAVNNFELNDPYIARMVTEHAGAVESLSAHVDVERYRSVLNGRFHFQDQDITVLKDAPGSHPAQEPSADNMRLQLSRLVEDALPGDSLFVSLSGHGFQTPNDDGTESDGMDENYMSTTGPISDDTLRTWLVDGLKPGCVLAVAADTCHAGTLLDLPYRICTRHPVWEYPAIVKRVASAWRSLARRGFTSKAALCSSARLVAKGVRSGALTFMRRLPHVLERTAATLSAASGDKQVLYISSSADHQETFETNTGGPLAQAFEALFSGPRGTVRSVDRHGLWMVRALTLGNLYDALRTWFWRYHDEMHRAVRNDIFASEDYKRVILNSRPQLPQICLLRPQNLHEPLEL